MWPPLIGRPYEAAANAARRPRGAPPSSTNGEEVAKLTSDSLCHRLRPPRATDDEQRSGPLEEPVNLVPLRFCPAWPHRFDPWVQLNDTVRHIQRTSTMITRCRPIRLLNWSGSDRRMFVRIVRCHLVSLVSCHPRTIPACAIEKFTGADLRLDSSVSMLVSIRCQRLEDTGASHTTIIEILTPDFAY